MNKTATGTTGSINIDAIKSMRKALEGFEKPFDDPFRMGMLGDLKMIIAPEHPKFKIKEHVPMTDATRREINAWLLQMFGTKSALGNSALICQGLGIAIINPITAGMINNLIV